MKKSNFVLVTNLCNGVIVFNGNAVRWIAAPDCANVADVCSNMELFNVEYNKYNRFSPIPVDIRMPLNTRIIAYIIDEKIDGVLLLKPLSDGVLVNLAGDEVINEYKETIEKYSRKLPPFVKCVSLTELGATGYPFKSEKEEIATIYDKNNIYLRYEAVRPYFTDAVFKDLVHCCKLRADMGRARIKLNHFEAGTIRTGDPELRFDILETVVLGCYLNGSFYLVELEDNKVDVSIELMMKKLNINFKLINFRKELVFKEDEAFRMFIGEILDKEDEDGLDLYTVRFLAFTDDYGYDSKKIKSLYNVISSRDLFSRSSYWYKQYKVWRMVQFNPHDKELESFLVYDTRNKS